MFHYVLWRIVEMNGCRYSFFLKGAAYFTRDVLIL